MTHNYHQMLPGYDPHQILHDGCDECETRGANPQMAIAMLDDERFEKAWKRAVAWNRDEEVGPVSKAERRLLDMIWTFAIVLERRGIPIGKVPGFPPDVTCGRCGDVYSPSEWKEPGTLCDDCYEATQAEMEEAAEDPFDTREESEGLR